jgi:hypothetical protein
MLFSLWPVRQHFKWSVSRTQRPTAEKMYFMCLWKRPLQNGCDTVLGLSER